MSETRSVMFAKLRAKLHDYLNEILDSDRLSQAAAISDEDLRALFSLKIKPHVGDSEFLNSSAEKFYPDEYQMLEPSEREKVGRFIKAMAECA